VDERTHLNDTDANSNANSNVLVVINEVRNGRFVTVLQPYKKRQYKCRAVQLLGNSRNSRTLVPLSDIIALMLKE